MQALIAHIAIAVLASCYALVSFAGPLEALARAINPGPKPQRITCAKPTKPLTGTSYVVARRHLPLTKQIEVPSHESPVTSADFERAVECLLPLESRCVLPTETSPTPERSRPPPSGLTIL